MLGDGRSQPSESDSAEALREALRGRGEYIERKFSARRAYDINPGYLEDTLEDIKSLSESIPTNQRGEIGRMRSIENQVFAAISLHDEPENRAHYFATLRGIADLLKRL
jgi:hypothetical protein